ncbi:hypothetical protein [Clostridium sp. D33t1_170424_F3]|uniref:hypothetical protein n=1 Tax=Clostridium sp. D33t1_170424_F3 TaxID=2787099 RepID=UPI0018A8EC19|nr:hypothetical protein [Clostridium sp. D33t1_170424_F3]
MQVSKKEAAPGVGSTQDGKVKCDNISIQSVEQNCRYVKSVDMVRELLWLKDVVERRYTDGAVYACHVHTCDDGGGAQANVTFTCAGELYTLTLHHEV